MTSTITRRWNKFRSLWDYRYYLTFYYGERVRDYPLKVGVKMLLSRIAFASQIPIILPDKHFLMSYYGAKMYIDLTISPVMVDVALGVYEYWKTKLFFDLVKEGMTILDIGACQGNYSILFAQLMHDRGRVLSFEPDPENCYWIRKNIQVNDFKCIELCQYALSDREGSATFYPGHGMGSLVASRPTWRSAFQQGPITVQTRILDSVLNDEDIRDVHIIKMDVEGSDLSVLRGAEHTLRSNNVSLLMDVDVFSNVEREELFEILNSCGFKIYRIGRELKPIEKADELFLFSEESKSERIQTHQMVREIYASKS